MGETTLCILFSVNDIPTGLNFVTAKDAFLQVGTWGYDSGEVLLPHIHNKRVERIIDRTQELVHVVKGRLRARIFSEDEREIESLEMHAGDTLALFAGGHGYEILEDGTRVLEVKNGPYVGPESDRRRIK
jgi:uncharacterized cupin superfamily protein